MHDYLNYLRIIFAVIKERNGKEKAKFCWNIRNVTYNKEEKDGIEKQFVARLLRTMKVRFSHLHNSLNYVLARKIA